jgi:ankyrin repeat protein
MIAGRMQIHGLLFLLLLLFGCQVSNGAGRVKLQDFYQERGTIELAEAAADGNVRRIDALMASGENINNVGKDGMTPLLWALMAKNKAGVRRLLELEASPNIAIKSGDSVVSLAAAMDDPEFLRMILEHGGNSSFVNAQDSVKPTPLFIAISHVNVANVQALVGSGADLNYRRAAGKETPMMAAAALNQWEIVYTLLAAGADYTLQNRWGNTVSYYIENNNIVANSELYRWRQKVVTFLEAKGISVSPKAPLN